METSPERFSESDTLALARRRVAVVSVRFTMFDAQMSPSFPSRMHDHALRSAELLRSRFDVIACPLIESVEDAQQVAEAISRVEPDAIVFAPAMAAPPSFADQALARSTAPVVIWNAPSILRLGQHLHQADVTEHTTTVGSVMYANVRSRQGLPVTVVTAAHDDPIAVDRVLRTVAAVAEGHALRGTRLLSIGDPIPGYLDVMATDEDLARVGVQAVRLPQLQWEEAVAGVSDKEAATLLADTRRSGWLGDPGYAATRSAKVALALGRQLDSAAASAGAVNCHGPWFRESQMVGVTACLGVACQATMGRPVACTGDLPTAIALLIIRRLTGSALYCECYAPEIDTGLALLAAGGEGDPGWVAPGTALRMEPNTHYPGRHGAGTAVAFELRCGPATLLSLSPAHDGWVLAWATGSVEESRYPELGGPNGMFRFDSGPPTDALTRWISSGATHHCALAPSRLDVEMPALAAVLGIREVRC